MIWVLIIIGAMLVARMLSHHNQRAKTAASPRRAVPRQNAAIKHPEAMVQCAHCRIHLPRSEAVLINGQTWCSTEHAKLGVRQ